MNTLSLPTELLLKHLARFTSKKALVINAPDSKLLSLLPTESSNTDWSFFDFEYSAHREKVAVAKQVNFSAEKLTCGAVIAQNTTYDLIIIFLPKSRELVAYTLALASAHTTQNGTVALVGEKKAGIKSARDVLEKHIGKIVWKEPGKHSEIIVAHLEKTPASFQPEYTETSVVIGNISLTTRSLPGVFSLGELDGGTRLLLEHLPSSVSGKVLDFGCGSGIIGTMVAKMYPEANVDMTDSSMLAIASAKETIKHNTLSNARVFVSDIFSHITESYDLIISNPPFHDGYETAYDVTHTFFKEAPRFLKPGGTVLIVANAFLPYQKILTEVFGNCRIVVENPQFKILESIR